jgi:uncharacterized protein (TIGR03435 family)
MRKSGINRHREWATGEKHGTDTPVAAYQQSPEFDRGHMEIRRSKSAADLRNLPTTQPTGPCQLARRLMCVIIAGTIAAAARPVAAQTRGAAALVTTEKEHPMPPDASPAFEVATIRPSDPNSTRDGFPTDGRHVSCLNESVTTIMSVAYGIHIKQIVDGPDWISKDRFDVNGIPDVTGVPNLGQMQQMYRKLLADRFHLAFHREVRDLPIYAIRITQGGVHLRPAKPDEHLNTGNRQSGGQRTLRFTNMPMSAFALNMNFYMDRPVIDQTSLNGAYDFTLTWTFDDAKVSDADAAPSIFTAVKEQLGLKFEAVKGPAEVFVIDDVERPSEN